MIAALQVVHPVVLGSGQALCGGIDRRLTLDLADAKAIESGRMVVTYRISKNGRKER